MTDEIADLRQRVANMIRRGVVSEVIPGNPVKVRVRLGKITTPPLPCIWQKLNRKFLTS